MLVGHFEFGHEFRRFGNGFHTINLLIFGHRQVNHHGARADGLIDRILSQVRDEDYTTSKLEGARQVFFAAEGFSIPGDHTLAIGVESCFEQVGSNRVFEDGVAIVEHDDGVFVFVECTIQALGCGVTLNGDECLGLTYDRVGFERTQIGEVLQTGLDESLVDGVGLSETAFAGDDSRRCETLSDHIDEVFYELEAFVDVELVSLGFLLFTNDFGKGFFVTGDFLVHVFDVVLFGGGELVTVDNAGELVGRLGEGDLY